MPLPIWPKGNVEPFFEKFIINNDYRVTKVTRSGHKILLDAAESTKYLDSDYFGGSIAITRDTKHVGFLHQAIYLLQRIHAYLFERSHNADPNMCHGMIILDQGEKKAGDSHHPFLIAHSSGGGVRTANRDYINDHEATEVFVYRPIDEEIRQLYKNYAEKTAFVEKKEKRTFFSPREKCPFSFWDSITSFFRNEKSPVYDNEKPIDRAAAKRAAYLVTDFLLQSQIKDSRCRPKGLFCSAYATIVLQGTLLLHALKGYKSPEILHFIHENAGPELSRERLVRKVYQSFVHDSAQDPIAHTLWLAYRKNKLTRIDSQYAMPIYITKTLDKLSIFLESKTT